MSVSTNRSFLFRRTRQNRLRFIFSKKVSAPWPLVDVKSSSSFNNISPPLCEQQKKETIIDGVIIAHSLGKDYL
jgi:hypothetical protein